jgi:maleate cis-trans isomerase
VNTVNSDGSRHRLGILTIHNDPVPEIEFWRAAPPTASVHTARFQTPRPTGTEFTGLELDQLIANTGLERSVAQLGDLGVDCICFCFVSSSVFGGPVFDDQFVAWAEAVAGCRVTTAGLAIAEALRAVGAQKIGLLAPPWFTPPTIEATGRYLLPAGIEIVQAVQFELGPEWNGIDRPDLFDRGARWVIAAEQVHAQAVAAFKPGLDTLLVPGSGFACADAARSIGAALQVPVLTANACSLWQSLRLTGFFGDDDGREFLLDR